MARYASGYGEVLLFGRDTVAMRVGATPTVFLMGDHLGSTSVAVNEQGAPVGGSPQLYKAWGETRAGSVPTKYQYTGQFNNTVTWDCIGMGRDGMIRKL